MLAVWEQEQVPGTDLARLQKWWIKWGSFLATGILVWHTSQSDPNAYAHVCRTTQPFWSVGHSSHPLCIQGERCHVQVEYREN